LEIAGGLGSQVEGSIRFALQETVGEDDTAGVEDSGGPVADDLDLRVGWAPRAARPAGAAMAAWLQVKLPTGPDKGGASTDETDAGVGVSMGTQAGRASLFAHGGLILLGNPLRNGAQDDVAGWGAGIVWPGDQAWSLTGELEGDAFSRFGNSAARLRLGARWGGLGGSTRPLSAGGVLWHGLTDDTATWGVELLATLAR